MTSKVRILVAVVFLFLGLSILNYVNYRQELAAVDQSHRREMISPYGSIRLVPYPTDEVVSARQHFVNREIALVLVAGVAVILLIPIKRQPNVTT